MDLRVLMFGWEFPPHNSGGLGTACEGLTRALAEQNVETIFVLPKTAATNANFLTFRSAELEKVKFKTISSRLYPYVTAEQFSNLYGLSLLEEVKLYAERSKAIALNEHFNVIHAHDWLSFPAGLAAQGVSGKPLIAHVHATEFDRGGGNSVNQEVYAIEKRGMEQADKVVAVSQWTKDLVTHHYGINPHKIEVIHNGINAHQYNRLPTALQNLKAAGSKIVLFVGRLTLQKGPDYFIKVAKRVLEFEPKTYFVMVGSGDMQGQVMQAAAYLGISDRVLFPGFLRGNELDQIYQAADLYILPSVSEPFGITPLEALANGTPVMVSKQSGVSEVLSHALKVDFWDVEEMTNQILSVLRHPTLQETLAHNGEKEVAKVTWTRAAKKCLDLYSTLTTARNLA